jgi:hypothetical protein
LAIRERVEQKNLADTSEQRRRAPEYKHPCGGSRPAATDDRIVSRLTAFVEQILIQNQPLTNPFG